MMTWEDAEMGNAEVMRVQKREMKASDKVAIGLLLLIFVFIAAFVASTIRSYVRATNWEIHNPMTAEEKALYSSAALLPDLAGCFERYARKGVRDGDYMVETYRYASIAEMCAALPEGCDEGIAQGLSESAPESAEDIVGTPVTRYTIEAGLPLVDREDLPEKYRHSYLGAFLHYYVIQYSDGSCRFVVWVQDT